MAPSDDTGVGANSPLRTMPVNGMGTRLVETLERLGASRTAP